MKHEMPSNLIELEKYVGKTFFMQYGEVEIVMLLGGQVGPPFFMCKWCWSSEVFCADPLEIITQFDDNYKAIEDLEMPE